MNSFHEGGIVALNSFQQVVKGFNYLKNIEKRPIFEMIVDSNLQLFFENSSSKYPAQEQSILPSVSQRCHD
jgi:hypothetical protein